MINLIEIIKNLFTNNKINTQIYCENLNKTQGESTPLSVVCTDREGNLLPEKPLFFEINGVEYTRITDENGIARLNINLPIGVYPVGVSFKGDDEYNKSSAYCKVYVNPTLIVDDLNMTFRDGSKFTAKLTDTNDKPISGVEVIFTVNNIPYTRITGDDGVASLNINLNAGDYTILTSVAGVNVFKQIHIDKVPTKMEGIDLTKNYGDTTPYQCAVYAGNTRVAGSVDLKINGKTYTRTSDENGLYKLNINLNPGTYDIVSTFAGDVNYAASSIKNTVVIKEAPAPAHKECTNPYISSPHPTNTGCNGMGQNTSTYCAPSSVHKCLYKFGIRDISQATLASWMATNSSGTSHQGIETGIAKVNQVKGTNIKIQWYNKSDLSWEEIGKILCQPNKAIFCHILYKNGGTCSGSGNYGHYELLTKVNTDTGYVKVLNSLGGYCGSCYCGFYQDRTMACQEQFMRGISQKSIAVLTMN